MRKIFLKILTMMLCFVGPLMTCTTAYASDFRIIIPIYNNKGLETVVKEFNPYISQKDILLLISGNFGSLDVSWLDKSIITLRDKYPDTQIYVGTGGLSNLKLVLNGIKQPINGIVYIYEPNLPQGPEFTWDFNNSLENVNAAAMLAHQHRIPFVLKPTGRPILQNALQKYNWDYGILGKQTDMMFVQTQTYAKDSTERFKDAIDKLQEQNNKINSENLWYPQVTIDPMAPNGTSVSQAIDCVKIAKSKQITGIMMWWSPNYKENAIEFLQQCG